MSELRKKGEAPLTPKESHQREIGKGNYNYNRFGALQPPPGRPRLGSKRKMEPEPDQVIKTPKLDANVMFGQLKDVEENLTVVKSAVSAVLTAATPSLT